MIKKSAIINKICGRFKDHISDLPEDIAIEEWNEKVASYNPNAMELLTFALRVPTFIDFKRNKLIDYVLFLIESVNQDSIFNEIVSELKNKNPNPPWHQLNIVRERMPDFDEKIVLYWKENIVKMKSKD